jgi:hypothetical protein
MLEINDISRHKVCEKRAYGIAAIGSSRALSAVRSNRVLGGWHHPSCSRSAARAWSD